MIVAILQARMSSRRLPGKVLRPILGKPMLQLQIERIKRAKYIDQIIVATSDDPSDDDIYNICSEIGVDCFRGSLDDVLDRFYRAATSFNAEHVVRLTGDCPLVDPLLIDKMIEYYFEGDFDFVTNTICPTFPDGLDVWVFRYSVLKLAWEQATLPSHREHVTLFMIQNPDLLRTGSFEESPNRSALRWTVDEPEDLEFVCKVYEDLYENNQSFTTQDILSLLDQKPELNTINEGFERDEGLKRSMKEDAECCSR